MKQSKVAGWIFLNNTRILKDLFEYVAQEAANGQIAISIHEICRDGSTSRIRLHTDKEFKGILDRMIKGRKIGLKNSK